MLELLPLLLLYLVLTGLPGIAAVLVGMRRGISSIPVLLALGLVASGAGAMVSFWAYYADPLAGESFAFLLVFGSAALIGWALRGPRLDPARLRALATPLALWALGSAFVLMLGFAHGGTDSALATSSIRFSHQLPADNYIPQFYADWFYENGHRGTPPIFPVEWLSSDRPPLQVGYVLAERPFGRGGDDLLRYQILGVVLQQLWIVGLWALLLAARVGRVSRALVVLAVLASPIAIVNGFYVWPKLLPAAMLLAVAALVLTSLWSEVRRTLWGAALVAALLALALLGHGSSVFGVVPLALIAAFRGMPSWRWIGVGLLVGVVAMAPWLAYQAYGDPPGNRLVKWMLAGVAEVDDRGSGETILDSYGEIGVGGALDNKADNFVAMAGGEPLVENVDNAIGAAEEGDFENALRPIRTIFFFNLLPGLGLLLVSPVAMALAWRRAGGSAEWSFALVSLGAFLLGAIGWGLLMFGGVAAETVVHQGSYLLPVLGLCGAVAGLRASFPRFAVGVTLVNALLMLALYAPALDPPDRSSYSALAVLAATAALAAFAAVGLRGAAPSSSSTP